MRLSRIALPIAVLFAAIVSFTAAASATDRGQDHRNARSLSKPNAQLGPRPFYLVGKMSEGPLKNQLRSCLDNQPHQTDFSIGHRGAAMQFPEHTKESYEAAARMGAGIVECDVTFTSDLELVCRHSQADLANTTNILVTPLASTCIVPFTPATFDTDGTRLTAATATCRTSEITKDEFLTLKGKMDARNRNATTAEEFQEGGTANFRTDLYATGGTLMTHAQSIELLKNLGVKFTPELKSASVAMPFTSPGGVVFSQTDYAQKMIDEYKDAGVPAADVFAQSFDIDDVLYWIANEPAFGQQAVFLEGRAINNVDPTDVGLNPNMAQIAAMGINIIAPPLWVLLKEDGGNIVPSSYAGAAKAAGLDIITWSLERSGRINEDVIPSTNFYYQSTIAALENDGDIFTTLDVLAQDVGIIGIFSDWPATVTYYANCKGL